MSSLTFAAPVSCQCWSKLTSHSSPSIKQRNMCDYTEVHYECAHLRHVVRAWCVTYLHSYKRCPVNVVARYGSMRHAGVNSAKQSREHRLKEKCGL
jgi:hypothetical protein